MPTTKTERDYYTVAQAADILEVSTTTVWRWIKTELLPAYRAGPKNIRIKKHDLERVVTPARETHRKAAAQEEVIPMKELTPISTALTFRPLTEEQAQRGLEALQQARELGQRILARTGGKPLSSSAPLIRAAREARSQQLL